MEGKVNYKHPKLLFSLYQYKLKSIVATGQEMVKEKNIQRQGEVREFYFKSGENWRFEEKSGRIEII